jgi:hypothetical protein
MLSKTRGMPVNSPAPGVIPDTITGPASNGSAGADGKAPTQRATPAHGGPASAHGSAASERDERRHQRAIAREGNGGKRGAKTDDGRKRGAKTGERLHQAKTQLAEPTRRGRLALGETVPLGLIGIVIVGLGVGAILGAVGAAGWVVGLLVATLTLMLSAVLRRSPASADAETSGNSGLRRSNRPG